jgi:hypothetical protein
MTGFFIMHLVISLGLCTMLTKICHGYISLLLAYPLCSASLSISASSLKFKHRFSPFSTYPINLPTDRNSQQFGTNSKIPPENNPMEEPIIKKNQEEPLFSQPITYLYIQSRA